MSRGTVTLVAVVLAVVGGAFVACSPFASVEDPVATADGGATEERIGESVDPEAATPPLPAVDAGAGCAALEPLPSPARLSFCSDFDDGTLDGWTKVTDDVGTASVSPVHLSPGFAASLETSPGASTSPDARIARTLRTGGRLIVSGSLRVRRSDAAGSVQLAKVSWKDGSGVVLFRSDGALVEIRRSGGIAEEEMRRVDTKVDLRGDRWLPFTLVLDLAKLTGRLDLPGKSVAMPLATNKLRGEVDLLLGPAEPQKADQGWHVLFDNVTAIRED